MTTRLIQGPQVEPITAQEALDFLNILDANQAAYVATLIAPVREWAEHHLHRSLATQTWEKVLDAFPGSNKPIELLMPPLQSITSVSYIKPDGTTGTMQNTDWLLDTDREPSWIMPAYGLVWPSTRATANAVRIRYVAGYAAPNALPQALRHWLLAHVASLDAERAAHTDGAAAVQPIYFLDRLVDRYRIIGDV